MKAASIGELAGTWKIAFLQNVLGQATTNTRKLALALLKFFILIFNFLIFLWSAHSGTEAQISERATPDRKVPGSNPAWIQ